MHNKIEPVGSWSNQKSPHRLIVHNADILKTQDNITEIETLVVVTKEEIPYVIRQKGKRGNSAYDGFAIDLLKVHAHPKFIMY